MLVHRTHAEKNARPAASCRARRGAPRYERHLYVAFESLPRQRDAAHARGRAMSTPITLVAAKQGRRKGGRVIQVVTPLPLSRPPPVAAYTIMAYWPLLSPPMSRPSVWWRARESPVTPATTYVTQPRRHISHHAVLRLLHASPSQGNVG